MNASAPKPARIHAYEVWVDGTDRPRHTVYSRNRGAAKYSYWLDVRDAWPSVPITAMRCRRIGLPLAPSTAFARVAKMRNMPARFSPGPRVLCGPELGTVVDHDSSCNFVVELDKGGRGHYHPVDFEVLS